MNRTVWSVQKWPKRFDLWLKKEKVSAKYVSLMIFLRCSSLLSSGFPSTESSKIEQNSIDHQWNGIGNRSTTDDHSSDLCATFCTSIDSNRNEYVAIVDGLEYLYGPHGLHRFRNLFETTHYHTSDFIAQWLCYSAGSIVPTRTVVDLWWEETNISSDCLDHSTSAEHFGSSISITTSSSPILLSEPLRKDDEFRFGDEGCFLLCSVLTDNRCVTRLSLTYCDLSSECGAPLGRLLVQTAIRFVTVLPSSIIWRMSDRSSEIYLDGNRLGCQGAYDLIKLLLADCERALIDKQDKLRAELELKAQEGSTFLWMKCRVMRLSLSLDSSSSTRTARSPTWANCGRKEEEEKKSVHRVDQRGSSAVFFLARFRKEKEEEKEITWWYSTIWTYCHENSSLW